MMPASHTTQEIVSGFSTRTDGGVIFRVEVSLHSIEWHFTTADKAHEWLASLSDELTGLQIDQALS
jgi:hypothetical protein